jgi:phosphatidylethanolamine/phosphatidyl-N-methylethanolamine N-methyltransferase
MPWLQRLDPYDLYSNFYDATFGLIFGHSLEYAIDRLGLKPGSRVLDVGIGTGLTLELYPKNVSVVGVDRSPAMVEKAQHRIEKKRLSSARVLLADAQQLPLPDNSFDAVLLGHVLTVVDDPSAVLREAQRVSRPGATVAVVGHFNSDWPLMSRIEDALSPLFSRIGWRTNLRFENFLGHEGLDLVERVRLRGTDLWDVAVFENRKSEPADTQPRRRTAGGG